MLHKLRFWISVSRQKSNNTELHAGSHIYSIIFHNGFLHLWSWAYGYKRPKLVFSILASPLKIGWEVRVDLLLLHVEKSQLRWIVHLIRMPPGLFPGEVFWACSTWRRPRKLWRDYFSQHASRHVGGQGNLSLRSLGLVVFICWL